MTDNEKKNILDLLTELATNDTLYKAFVTARNDPKLGNTFKEHIKELNQKFTFEENTLNTLLTGDEQKIKDWLKGLVEDGKHGIWVMIYLLEPNPEEKGP